MTAQTIPFRENKVRLTGAYPLRKAPVVFSTKTILFLSKAQSFGMGKLAENLPWISFFAFQMSFFVTSNEKWKRLVYPFDNLKAGGEESGRSKPNRQ